jgi:hypothetical protein
MADKKISQLTASTTPLAGTEVLPIVQSGSTVKVAVSDLTAGRAVSASSVTASTGSFVVNTAGQGVTTGSAIALGFGVNSAVNAITITTTNAVGIGTSSPNGALTLQKAVSAGDTIFDITNSAGSNNANKCLIRFNTAVDFISYETLSPYVGGYMENASIISAGLVFGTFNGSAPLERMRITAAGNVNISTGNVVIGTAAKGIDFSANSGAAGMTSELLTWYEEGTWTPTDGSGAGLSFSNVANNCFYTRIGRMVVCVFGLSYPATASVSSAALLGLPFTSKTSASNVAGGYTTYTDAGQQIQLLVGNNDTSVTLWKNTGAAITNLELSGKWLRGVITYFV